MKSVHVVSSLHAEGGGPSYTVPRLAEAIKEQSWEVQIATLEAPDTRTKGGVAVRVFGRDAMPVGALARLGRSRAMTDGLTGLGGDVLHMHGLWMMPNVYPARVARRMDLPLVLAPRGMLGTEALKFSRNAKRAFWAIWQKRAVAAVSCFHATAASEYEDIRSFGLRAPVAIIPNGVDLPTVETFPTASGRLPFVLSLGRLHPKKGLNQLIVAFASVAAQFPEWHLRIVGIDEDNYGDVLRRCIAEVGLEGRAHIEDPVFDAEKYRMMAEAELFVLPSLHENFAVTVAESLAVRTPVISSKGAPWAGLETERCGWWVDHGIDPLAEVLKKAMALPAEVRADMGAKGREWMRRDFAWEGLGARMVAVYDWLLQRGPVPPDVIL